MKAVVSTWRSAIYLLSVGMLVLSIGCEKKAALEPDPPPAATIVGEWECIVRNSEAMGGADQSQIHLSFGTDLQFVLDDWDPPNAEHLTGSYVWTADSLSFNYDQAGLGTDHCGCTLAQDTLTLIFLPDHDYLIFVSDD